MDINLKEEYLRIKNDYLKLKSLFKKDMDGGTCYNPLNSAESVLKEYLDLFDENIKIEKENLTLPAQMIGMTTNNSCDISGVARRLKDKTILIIDYANIIAELSEQIYGSRNKLTDDQKLLIEAVMFKFLREKLLTNKYLIFIVAKDYNDIRIESIMDAFFHDSSRNSMLVRALDNLFIYRCRYYDLVNNRVMIVSGGIDDFIFWYFCILFHNLSMIFGSGLEIMTFDKQQRYGKSQEKTLFSDIIPSDKSIDRYVANLKKFEGITLTRPDRTKITIFVDRLLPNTNYSKHVYYRDDVMTKYFAQAVVLFSNEIVPTRDTTKTYISGTVLSDELMEYYNTAIEELITLRGETTVKTLKSIRDNFETLTDSETDKLFESLDIDLDGIIDINTLKSKLESKRNILLPKLLLDFSMIVPLVIRFLFYLDLLQIIYFGDVEDFYNVDDFKDVFHIPINQDTIPTDPNFAIYRKYRISINEHDLLVYNYNNGVTIPVDLEPHIKGLRKNLSSLTPDADGDITLPDVVVGNTQEDDDDL